MRPEQPFVMTGKVVRNADRLMLLGDDGSYVDLIGCGDAFAAYEGRRVWLKGRFGAYGQLRPDRVRPLDRAAGAAGPARWFPAGADGMMIEADLVLLMILLLDRLVRWLAG